MAVIVQVIVVFLSASASISTHLPRKTIVSWLTFQMNLSPREFTSRIDKLLTHLLR